MLPSTPTPSTPTKSLLFPHPREIQVLPLSPTCYLAFSCSLAYFMLTSQCLGSDLNHAFLCLTQCSVFSPDGQATGSHQESGHKAAAFLMNVCMIPSASLPFQSDGFQPIPSFPFH